MEQIISDFEKFAGKHGTHYHQFYIGVASDAKDRLTNGHNVDYTIPHIYSTNPLHTDIVRTIEKHFLNKGAKGGPGGGDNNTRYIYMYLVGPKTRE